MPTALTAGNILTKSGTSYSYESNKPHAVTGISGPLFNSNQTVTYNNVGLPETIGDALGNKLYTLSYGVDKERARGVYSENGATQVHQILHEFVRRDGESFGHREKLLYLRRRNIGGC